MQFSEKRMVTNKQCTEVNNALHYSLLRCTNVWTKDTEEFECDIFHHFFDFDSFSATEGLFMTSHKGKKYAY